MDTSNTDTDLELTKRQLRKMTDTQLLARAERSLSVDRLSPHFPAEMMRRKLWSDPVEAARREDQEANQRAYEAHRRTDAGKADEAIRFWGWAFFFVCLGIAIGGMLY